MYEKKIDGVINPSDMLGVMPVRRKRIFRSGIAAVAAKYLAYLLGVVLTLLLVALAVNSIILSPVESYSKLPALGSEKTVDPETTLATTAAIMPKTSVYYHGVRLGEFSESDATVEDALSSFNISLGENDVMNYSPDTSLFYGMTLTVDEISYHEEIIDSEIPFETVEIASRNIPKGTRQVQVEGVAGSSCQVIRTKIVNGEATDESSSFSRYIEPVNEEVLVGVGGEFTAPDGTVYSYSYYLDVTATAYTHTGNRTYSGTVAEVGVIAVDPRNIDLGSNVYVIGNYGDYGVCRAEDIGGGIKGHRIDVFLDTEEECVKFGRRKMRVYILE